ncbi:hypothetical protein [Mesorhizobium sp. M1076]
MIKIGEMMMILDLQRQGLSVSAIAREMAAFLWAIGHQVEPVR